jgi:hypothetical protein
LGAHLKSTMCTRRLARLLTRAATECILAPKTATADWPRARIEEVIASHPAELAGEMASGMGHGLVVHDGSGWLFIATRGKEQE